MTPGKGRPTLTGYAIALIAGFSITAAAITGFLVWILNPATIEKPAAAPITTTTTKTDTVTVTAPPPRPSGPPKSAGTQYVVRTPAGMACALDDRIVTCMGTFDFGVEGYYWAAGTSSADKISSPVQMPGQGETLAYGVRRSAGPWLMVMNRSGITFEHQPTKSTITFSKAGAAVG